MATPKSHISARNGARARGASKVVSVSCTFLLAVPTVLLPYEITFDNQAHHLRAQTALAKDAGKGGGNGNANGQGGNNGNGNANGQGGNNGNGNAKGQGGDNGNGNAKGQGGDNGNGNAKGQGGDNGNATGGGTVSRSPAESRDSVEIGAPARKVEHANGMMEAIANGRYVMKDAKGRTIINRNATPSDQLRLQSFTH